MKAHRWVTTALTMVATMMLVLGVLAPSAIAGPKPAKHWNLYVDKLGVYTVTTADPKGQTLVAHPFATPEEAWATLSTPPTIQYALTPSAPDGQNGWFVSNVTLDWTILDAPGVLPGFMQVTGGGDQSITTDQQATTYSASATSVGGSAGPIEVTIARDATDPGIVWTGGPQNGQSYEVGFVPEAPTIEATDATSGPASPTLVEGYGTAVGVHTLTATAYDQAGNMTVEQRGYTVFKHPATLEAPTVKPETFNSPGVANPGGITVPEVTGIDYFLDGEPAAGFYEFYAGTHLVTAAPQTDYEMVGDYPPGGWSLEILPADVTVEVTPGTPTKVDQQFVSPGVASPGGINIPDVTGVNYLIDGTPAPVGFVEKSPAIYQVTAEPQFGYAFNQGDVSSWTLEVVGIDPIVHVTPAEPLAIAQTADAMGGIEIAPTTGVVYKIDGTERSGFYPLDPGDYLVTAEPEFGYALEGQTSWPLTVNPYVPPIIEVTPAAPTATDQTANASGFVTIPVSEGVDYALDGAAVAAGNHNVVPGDYAITATAQPGYALLGQTNWDLTVNPYVPPKQVEFVGRTVAIQAGTSVALPAGWQPGDLAVVMVMKNGNSGSVPATVPSFPTQSGWTRLTVGPTTVTSTGAQVASGLFTKVLTATDAAPTWSTGFRGAAMMVYRNAALGAVAPASGTTTTLTLPGLTLQQNNGTSWVGGFAACFNGMRNATAPTGMINRTAGTGDGLGVAVGGFDTNGGVASWTSRTMTATSAPWNAFSFELKVSA